MVEFQINSLQKPMASCRFELAGQHITLRRLWAQELRDLCRSSHVPAPQKLRNRQNARRRENVRITSVDGLTLSFPQNTRGPCENFYLAPYPSVELLLRITDSGL